MKSLTVLFYFAFSVLSYSQNKIPLDSLKNYIIEDSIVAKLH